MHLKGYVKNKGEIKMSISLSGYSVGPLLYCPATNTSIYYSLISEKFGTGYSLAFCLEDTIADRHVEMAENLLAETIQKLYSYRQEHDFFLPKIFIRVRNAGQIPKMFKKIGQASCLVTGFNIPKISLENTDAYITELLKLNHTSTFYMMPIIENPDIIPMLQRQDILYGLKEKLDTISSLVLNVRVGGNDLCHAFGFRRRNNESIHSIGPIHQIFSDVMTVFGMNYVISAAVWEYYRGEGWDTGLQAELLEDRLNGFIGKTIIHPNQIPLVKEAYRVPKKDYDDARQILGWEKDAHTLVLGSISGERMNECKTHSNWAKRIMMQAEAYGVEE